MPWWVWLLIGAVVAGVFMYFVFYAWLLLFTARILRRGP